MNSNEFKYFIVGFILAALIALVVFQNKTMLNQNGRYQFSPHMSQVVIDTQTGTVKMLNLNVPFDQYKKRD